MSFFQDQEAILKNCAFQTTAFIAPVLGALNFHAKDSVKKNTWGSVGFFASCIVKDEFNYFARQRS